MKLTLTTALLAGLFISAPLQAQSGVPSEMSYQAVVTDDAGALLAPAAPVSYEISVRVFADATGGVALWSEQHVTDVFRGRFSIILGQGAPIPVAGGGNEIRPVLETVFGDSERFVELTVRQNTPGAIARTLSPRQKLVSSAFAFRASVAAEAETVKDGSIVNADLAGGISATKLGTGDIDDAELSRLNGVVSPIQDQINSNKNDLAATTANLQAQINQKATSNQLGLFTRLSIGVSGANRKGRVHIGLNDGTIGGGPHGFLNRLGSTGVSNLGLSSSSIYAESTVYGATFYAFSDARIKKVIGRSEGADDLEVFNKLKVTDYTHIDVVNKGKGLNKRLIAQEVERVFPQAVTQSSEVIPDIYQLAKVEAGWVKLATNLKKGESVRLIGDKGARMFQVAEVVDGKFRVVEEMDDSEVFVYGREVDDFLAVDYDAISMLNVSASQEIYRRLEAKEKEVETLKARLDAMSAKMAKIEQMLSAGKEMAQPVSVSAVSR